MDRTFAKKEARPALSWIIRYIYVPFVVLVLLTYAITVIVVAHRPEAVNTIIMKCRTKAAVASNKNLFSFKINK